ncbi:ATPase [Dyella lipolytica]|uniref:ATP-binding protein n=1 Tax=Dyella lipolytica TaxID=1867835 RepID=A0ABW8IY43_9GAMM|nr:AAA family ATPase [Dyella lipolytica]GLQ45828.1 ATPase [Dyella lipolytica]
MNAVAAETLQQALERVYGKLQSAAGAEAPTPVADEVAATENTLQQLQSMFGLSEFERDLLVLCVGTSIEARFLTACATIHGNPQCTWPTFGLALATLDQAHWSSISRVRPLRYWSLIDVVRAPGSHAPLLHAPLQVDERILLYLLNVSATDERIEALMRPLPMSIDTPRSENTRLNAILDEGLRHWLNGGERGRPLLFCGERGASREAAFTELCRRADLNPYYLHAFDLPADIDERRTVARLWTRESALQHAALFVRCNDSDNLQALSGWLDLVHAPVAIDTPMGSQAEYLSGLRLDIPNLSAAERKQTWIGQLGDASHRLNGTLDRIVDYFHFDETAIQSAAAIARETPLDDEDDIGQIAWRICRQQGRRSLDNLARRIEPRATWSELVLPPAQTETLQQIAIHMRQRAVVNQQWGFSERYSRGHGLNALFAGGSGTGKTMAAEILARELDLDLYQIDLASMVSKYIGETEKNLRRVFDAAEESGAVLLFDECDALFGKRSEVRDSHDRYANMEVSYLLQRMDSYRGVAILTTNMRHAMDSAFMRRIRFIVQFPFPDAPSRARIWQGIFPELAPCDDLDFEQLSQLNVSGGVIRNIATHAAFLAAEDSTSIGTQHILAASRAEYAKMEKPLTTAETRGWS